MAEFGEIDILVDNAGTSPVYTLSLDLEERAWDSIMNLNLKGLFFLSQAVARVMKEHGGGKIINVASMDGIRPEVNIGAYAISKAGVIMATKVMAVELAQYNIRVNAIAPGNVHTRLGDSRFDVAADYMEEFVARTPVKRQAEPAPRQRHPSGSHSASQLAQAPGFAGQTLCRTQERARRQPRGPARGPLPEARPAPCPGTRAAGRRWKGGGIDECEGVIED